jgi:cell fate (sporulation/competence/biofilm development) regulator YlbF (YheA/YmcA/DUF963 family)
MSDGLMERAKELGRMLGQTDEYKAVHRARERLQQDRELTQLLKRLVELEAELTRSMERGEEPPAEARTEYEQSFSEVQSSPIYQGLVAAQGNFDRVLERVYGELGKGMEAAAKSRIILPD